MAHLPSLPCQHERGCHEPRRKLPLLQRRFHLICSTCPRRASLPHRAACKLSYSNRSPPCSPLDDAQSALSRITTAASKHKRVGISRDGLPFSHATEKQKEAKGKHRELQQAPNPSCSDSKTRVPLSPHPHSPHFQVAQVFNPSGNGGGCCLFLDLPPPKRVGGGFHLLGPLEEQGFLRAGGKKRGWIS